MRSSKKNKKGFEGWVNFSYNTRSSYDKIVTVIIVSFFLYL